MKTTERLEPPLVYLFLRLMQESLEQFLHIRGLDRVWPVALDALIGAWAFAARRQHQLHGPSALRTHALVYRHHGHPAKDDPILVPARNGNRAQFLHKAFAKKKPRAGQAEGRQNRRGEMGDLPFVQ